MNSTRRNLQITGDVNLNRHSILLIGQVFWNMFGIGIAGTTGLEVGASSEFTQPLLWEPHDIVQRQAKQLFNHSGFMCVGFNLH